MCLSIVVHDPSRLLAAGEHRGFEFNITKNSMGYRCGYVKVLPGHPWFGSEIHCGADHLDHVKVHGGITFSEPDLKCGKGGADNGWWVGFDCGHAWDLPDPELVELQDWQVRMHEKLSYDSAVRTQGYVMAQCMQLCDQAADATGPTFSPAGQLEADRELAAGTH